MHYKIILFVISIFTSYCVYSQTDNVLIKENISRTLYDIDSEARAVILYESKSVVITKDIHAVGSKFSQHEHVNRIVKFLSTTDMSLANIHLYTHGNNLYNYVENVEGKTYNKEGSEVKETWLTKKDVYAKEIRDEVYETTFSLPAVKEGSIIVYSYDIVSSVRDILPEWEIQGRFPKLVTSYNLSYPQDLEFTSIAYVRPVKVNYPSIQDAFKGVDEFCNVSIKPQTPDMPVGSFWLRRNVPGVKNEPFVYNSENNLESMILQLTGYMDVNGMTHVDNSWPKLDKLLLDNKFFGTVRSRNAILDETVTNIRKLTPFGPELVRSIYNYVRSSYTVNNDQSRLYSKHSIEDVFNNKQGSSIELNMLLCAMLLNAEIEAYPLLLATTGNVSPNAIFPTLDRFNYLACAVKQDSGYLLLDASDRNNVYGMLQPNCYNGYARVLKKSGGGEGIELGTDMMYDKQVIAVKISGITDTSANIEVTQKLGLVHSSALRKAWHKSESLRQKFIDKEMNDHNKEITITSTNILFEDRPDTNLIINLNGVMKMDKRVNVLYLNAFFIKDVVKNPFVAAKRIMPIEFPCRTQEQYYLSVMLPAGYEFTDMPKSIGMDIDSGAMHYTADYNYYEGMRTLTLKSVYTINTTSYSANAYDQIKSFYRDMMKEENAIITIKKNQ